MQDENIVHTLDNTVEVTGSKKGIAVKIVLIILLVIVGVTALLAILTIPPALALSKSVKQLETSGKAMVSIAKSQDLLAMKSQLSLIDKDLNAVESDYKKLFILKYLPIANNYYNDGLHGLVGGKNILEAGKVTVDTIAPYADVIGLKGVAGGGDGGKTAQDRINFIVNTLDKVQPQLDKIAQSLDVARREINQIDPRRYPEDFKGVKVRSQLTTGISLLDQAAAILSDAKPLLQSAPYMLGINAPRQYLLIFQNDAELRPTGGFMTGYAVIQVSKGKISTLLSDDIYKLDEKFPKRIPAPDPIKKYHPNVPYWYLRDQNLSPDFRVSMETFYPNYLLTKSPKIDGIIAVNTKLLVNLLKVTGRIGVPGFGNFSADTDPRCDCPTAFYEMQLLAGIEEPVIWDSVSGKIIKAPANYGNRKAFLGPIMYSILANVMAQPKNKIPELFNTMLSSIAAKDVLFYFPDVKQQTAVESFNMAGRIREYNQDYLMIVDTNFSGGKTNIWVKYKADQTIDISGDGTVTKTLVLTYSNPEGGAVKTEAGRKLNGLFRDWLRVYVPQGSELIEGKGFEVGQATSTDLGKTVFEGFFTLAPLNNKTITLKYKLPFKVNSSYKILVQKQGGAKDFPYNTKINGKSQEEFLLDADKEIVWTY